MQTNPTAYAGINELLEELLTNTQNILGEKLVGVYLYGSLVIGDFDPTISDIDLVAALTSDLDDEEFAALQKNRESSREWLADWYVVRKKGITLFWSLAKNSH
jgi:predicted nucleotidyltransferase